MSKRVKIFIFIVVLFRASLIYAFDGYGACMFTFIGNEEDVAELIFEPLEKAGVKWIRFPFAWDKIEPKKGVYDFEKLDRFVGLAQKHHIRVLGAIYQTPDWTGQRKTSLPADDEDWKRFVGTLVNHYKGSISHWQIWNEPDERKFPDGTPEQYLALLKSAYKIIKSIDPSIRVVSAGGIMGNDENGYFYKLLGLGMAEYTDIMAFHLYGRTPEKSLQILKNFLESMKKHKIEKPIWVTEIGWQTGGWRKGHSIVKDEETKAFYLKEAFRLLKPYAEVIFWHKAVSAPKKFGLIEIVNDGNIRFTPSYNAYKELRRNN